jgi:hypothetical protein
MKLNQLKLLCAQTPRIQGVAKMTKSAIITELLKQLPKPLQSGRHKQKLEELETIKRGLIDTTSQEASLIQFYNNHYGWLDQVDKDLYKFMNTIYHHTWQKLMGCTYMMYLFRHCWVIFKEKK